MNAFIIVLFIIIGLAYISSFAANDANIRKIQEDILNIKINLESIEMESLRMICCDTKSCMYSEHGYCTKAAITIVNGGCISHKRELNMRDSDQYVRTVDPQTNEIKVVPANFTGVYAEAIEVNEN